LPLAAVSAPQQHARQLPGGPFQGPGGLRVLDLLAALPPAEMAMLHNAVPRPHAPAAAGPRLLAAVAAAAAANSGGGYGGVGGEAEEPAAKRSRPSVGPAVLNAAAAANLPGLDGFLAAALAAAAAAREAGRPGMGGDVGGGGVLPPKPEP
jgi:hypothetical protein